MSESGGLLHRGSLGGGGGGSFSSSGEFRSYGALGNHGQSIMLTKFDVKSFTHDLHPNDTLQGLAVKYGVTVCPFRHVMLKCILFLALYISSCPLDGRYSVCNFSSQYHTIAQDVGNSCSIISIKFLFFPSFYQHKLVLQTLGRPLLPAPPPSL